MDIQLDSALACEGFMTKQELWQLAVWASVSNHIVEIGSYMGRSTRAMADNTQGTIFAYDDFGGLRENHTNPESNDIRQQFRINLGSHLESGRVILHEVKHEQITPVVCDMCFIDGSHDYDSVCRDIQLWMPSTHGLICGHDFDVAHYGVQLAVDRMIPGYRVAAGTTLWWAILP